MLKLITIAACGLAFGSVALAKLPAPTPEQQQVAALNAARTAHANKVAAFQLCESENRVAAAFIKEQKAKGNTFTPEATPACVNPGPFVPPPELAAVAAAQAAAAKPAAPAAAAPAAKAAAAPAPAKK
jgi:hypothetical protein